MLALLRVKRRQEESSPTDLIIEGLGSKKSPTEALAVLQLTPALPVRKRCKFRFIKTSSDLETEQSLLRELARSQADQQKAATQHPATNTSAKSSTTIEGTYRQVHNRSPSQLSEPQWQFIDIVHERENTTQSSRTLTEEHVTAQYYPLVQQYLQQQNIQQQPEEQDVEDFVFDYYAMNSDMDTTDADNANLPVIQVTENWLYLDENNADSEQGDSEDSNAEDWYGNDYPSSSESQDSKSYAGESESDD